MRTPTLLIPIGLLFISLLGVPPSMASAYSYRTGTRLGPASPEELYVAPPTIRAAVSGDSFVDPAGMIMEGVHSLRGPEGAAIRNIVPDPIDSRIIYLGTFEAGIHKSTEGGASWFPVMNGMKHSDFRALSVHPMNPSLLLAAGFAQGPWRSEDAGASWAVSNTGTYGSTGLEFAFHPTDPARVYYGDAGNFFVSTDTGNTWSEVPIPGTNSAKNAIAIDPTASSRILVGTDDGLFHSTDDGATWQEITQGFGQVVYPYVRDIAFDSVNPLIAYVAFFSHYTGANGGIYRSTDRGYSWQSSNVGIPTNDNFDYHSLAVDPVHAGHAYVVSMQRGVFKTTDAGLSWQESFSGVPTSPRDCWAVAVSPDGNSVYAGNAVPEGGFYLSTNAGATWGRSSTHLYAEYASGLEWAPFAPDRFVMGVRGGIFRWSNLNGSVSSPRTAVWERICQNLPSGNMINRSYEDIALFPSGFYLNHTVLAHSGVFVSFDDGVSCIDHPNAAHWTNSIVAHQSDVQHVFVAAADGVYESTNAGTTWTARNNGLTNLSCQTIAMDPNDPMRLYVGTGGGGAFRSVNGGLSWSAINNGFPLGEPTEIFDIEIDPTDSMRLYAVNSERNPENVYRSMDGGNSWQALNTGLSGVADIVGKLVIAPANPRFLVALDPYETFVFGGPTNPHVLVSTNGGDSWEVLSEGLLYTNVAVAPSDPPAVIAGAIGMGALQISGPPIDPSDVVEWNPGEIGSIRTWTSPNPATDDLVIRLGAGKAVQGHVRVEIFDLGGRLVRNLAGQAWEEDGLSLVWDRRDNSGRPVSVGVYVYRLLVSGLEIAGKTTVLR